MANENVITLTSENFEETVINSDIPVLVDFWAEWCGPCRMTSPVIDELAEDFAGRAKIGKVNVDEQSELAIKYKVMTIPNIITFKNGEICDNISGGRPKEVFAEMLDALI